MTNAEKIKSMTDEELAYMLMCPAEYDLNFNRNCTCNGEMKHDCIECTKQWLQSEQVQEFAEHNVGRKIDVTLSLFFEIKDAAIFGGAGEVGYVEEKLDLKTDNLANIKLRKFMQRTISHLAKMLKVPEENVRAISRTEYEENTED